MHRRGSSCFVPAGAERGESDGLLSNTIQYDRHWLRPNGNLNDVFAIVFAWMLNPTNAAVTVAGTSSRATFSAYKVNTYRCGGSPAGGHGPPYPFVPKSVIPFIRSLQRPPAQARRNTVR